MYQRILATMDGSQLAECVLPHVRAIATGCNVPEVVLLRVVESLSATTISAMAEATVSSDLISRAELANRTEAREYVSRVAAQLKKDGIAAKPVTVDGLAADAILAYAAKSHADLIVMSTHGRSGISRWLMGSVTDRVVRHSPVPVLTVAPTGCRTSPAAG